MGDRPVAPRGSHRATAAVAALAALAAVALSACSSAQHTGSPQTPTPLALSSPSPTAPPSPAPSSSSAPVPTATTPIVAGAGFKPMSVTFVSTSTGFALGSRSCASAQNGCLALERTSDGGHNWTAANPPGAAVHDVSQVRFADAADGWAFGPQLWSTHDGGTHWTQQNLSGGSVQSLEVAAGTAHALVLDLSSDRIRILSSPATHDAWTASTTTLPIGAGPVPQGQIVLQGSAGWAIEIDRTVMGGARRSGGTWSSWQPPCSSAGGFAALSAGTTTHLAAVCDEGTWTGPSESVHLYTSTNGGSSFTRFAQPIGALASPGNATAVTISSTGTIVVGGSRGVTPSGVLVASFDGGSSWTTVYTGDTGIVADELGFTTSSQGVAITAGDDPHLLMTYDGGHHWSPVAFA